MELAETDLSELETGDGVITGGKVVGGGGAFKVPFATRGGISFSSMGRPHCAFFNNSFKTYTRYKISLIMNIIKCH